MRTTAFICIEVNGKIHYTYVYDIVNANYFINNASTFTYFKALTIIRQYAKVQDIDINGVRSLNIGNVGGIDVRVVDSVYDLKFANYVILFKESGIEYYINHMGHDRYTSMSYKEIMNQYFWINFSQDNIKQAKSKVLKNEFGFVSAFEAKKDAHIRCEGHKIILVNAMTNEYEVIDLCGVV